jgi:hypothetical protein
MFQGDKLAGNSDEGLVYPSIVLSIVTEHPGGNYARQVSSFCSDVNPIDSPFSERMQKRTTASLRTSPRYCRSARRAFSACCGSGGFGGGSRWLVKCSVSTGCGGRTSPSSACEADGTFGNSDTGVDYGAVEREQE